jgi:hypothetical protein
LLLCVSHLTSGHIHSHSDDALYRGDNLPGYLAQVNGLEVTIANLTDVETIDLVLAGVIDQLVRFGGATKRALQPPEEPLVIATRAQEMPGARSRLQEREVGLATADGAAATIPQTVVNQWSQGFGVDS